MCTQYGNLRLQIAQVIETDYDQPRQHIEKQRHYFANKGPCSQGCGFSMVVYGCESCTVKKAERLRTDAFKLWCWRRLLKSLGLQGDPTSPF